MLFWKICFGQVPNYLKSEWMFSASCYKGEIRPDFLITLSSLEQTLQVYDSTGCLSNILGWKEIVRLTDELHFFIFVVIFSTSAYLHAFILLKLV